jgi:hypothetical protein
MSIIVERDVACAMRDGRVLHANILRPADDLAHPVLVFRTPYDKNNPLTAFMTVDAMRAVEAGYAVVHQDTRGRFASEGTSTPLADEFDDGYDTVEWAARQSWSNGRVGAFGTSYHGFAAWAAAAAGAPSLQAVAASQAPDDSHRVFWRGGAFELGMHLNWSLRLVGPGALLRAEQSAEPADRAAAVHTLVDDIDDFAALAQTLPLRSLPAGRPADPFLPHLYDLFEQRDPDAEFHRARSIGGRHHEITVPALIIAGWNDPLLSSDLEHYAALRTDGASETARNQSRLVIGPWVHGAGLHSSAAGEIDYGTRASGLAMDLREDLTGLHLRWFDRWLKDAPADAEPRVRIFVMGTNRWREADDWPLSGARPQRWHLQADGGLSPQAPATGAAARSYVHDPHEPVPTIGGATLLPPAYRRGASAQTELLQRPDVLVFTSEVLQRPLEVIGHVRAQLWAATSARDADWIVKLCDVHPGGSTFNVCDGIIRAGMRTGQQDVRGLDPGEPVRYEIDLLATAQTFLPGHRLRLLVMSSDFPRYDRNPGTGEWGLDAERLVAATQTVHCDAQRPSFIELPVMEEA